MAAGQLNLEVFPEAWLSRITNAGTEGTNRMVKNAARIAFGFRNLDNQRRRVRFHCTRRLRRTTSAEAVQAPQL